MSDKKAPQEGLIPNDVREKARAVSRKVEGQLANPRLAGQDDTSGGLVSDDVREKVRAAGQKSQGRLANPRLASLMNEQERKAPSRILTSEDIRAKARAAREKSEGRMNGTSGRPRNLTIQQQRSTALLLSPRRSGTSHRSQSVRDDLSSEISENNSTRSLYEDTNRTTKEITAPRRWSMTTGGSTSVRVARRSSMSNSSTSRTRDRVASSASRSSAATGDLVRRTRRGSMASSSDYRSDNSVRSNRSAAWNDLDSSVRSNRSAWSDDGNEDSVRNGRSVTIIDDLDSSIRSTGSLPQRPIPRSVRREDDSSRSFVSSPRLGYDPSTIEHSNYGEGTRLSPKIRSKARLSPQRNRNEGYRRPVEDDYSYRREYDEYDVSLNSDRYYDEDYPRRRPLRQADSDRDRVHDESPYNAEELGGSSRRGSDRSRGQQEPSASTNYADGNDGEKDRVLVEVMPGEFVPLRGSAETWKAVRMGHTTQATCFGCMLPLVCINDADMVMCPGCRFVSPVDGIGGGGLGLGMREEEALAASG